MKKKVWMCRDCGKKFSTQWVPFSEVSCPNCGSSNVHRVDSLRGRRYGPRHKRMVCR